MAPHRAVVGDEDPDFGTRLSSVVGLVGTYEQAAEIAKVTGEQLRKWRDRKAKPNFFGLSALAAATSTSLDWLATGQGSMHVGPAPHVVGGEDAREGDLVSVPFVMASASAGSGLVPVSEDTMVEMFSSSFLRRYGLFPRTTAALIVKGDSMLRPDGTGIPSGAMAIIDTAITEEDVVTGCIYVLVRGDELLIKRIERHVDGTITLHPDNARYKSEHVPKDVMPDIHIVGLLKVAVLEVR